jgi:hypothetical protein
MSDPVDEFIDRWRPSGGSEMANFQSFANELTGRHITTAKRAGWIKDGRTAKPR